ncbi:Zn-dependent exopeptidase [Martensiomyces pterosporus]|nr:Zn-dependent exopeptidase [Martensiomyces pterosporus]
MSSEQTPFLGSGSSQDSRGGIYQWWQSRSRDALSFLTVLLLLGTGLGIWVYGTLPTSDQDGHPHEYALSTERIKEHLNEFLAIAEKHNNSRSVTNGHAASASYVISQLKAHGNCDVHVQHFKSPVWTVNSEPRFAIRGPMRVDYIFETDFQIMRYGGQGARLGDMQVARVGKDGCSAEGVGDVAGKVAVVHPSSKCTVFESAFLLEQLGAKAVVFVRPAQFKSPSTARVRITDWKESDPLMTIPVLSVTHSVGQVLESSASVRVDIETDTRIDVVKTFNVICVGRTGDPKSTVLVGSHLDSVAAGPGINDNGSGSASTLEIHLTLARLGYEPRNRLVFAWWGAEEDGLLGSRHFARVLAHGWSNKWTAKEPVGVRWEDIALDLNFDMLGSPNYIALVHNGTDAPENARSGSQHIQRVFEDYFVRHGYPYKITDMLAGSDFLPFVDNGIPAGGVLTGAGEIKTIAERRMHGGLANAALDTCYHRDCDGILNINMRGLDQMSKAAMYAVSTLSSTTGLRDFLNGKGSRF